MLAAPKKSQRRQPHQRLARGGDRRYTSDASPCVSPTACRPKRTCTYESCTRLESCTRDPIGYEGSPWNLYEFVSSSPVQNVDPSGTFELKPYGGILDEDLSMGHVVCIRVYFTDQFFCIVKCGKCYSESTGRYQFFNAPCSVLCLFSCQQFKEAQITLGPDA